MFLKGQSSLRVQLKPLFILNHCSASSSVKSFIQFAFIKVHQFIENISCNNLYQLTSPALSFLYSIFTYYQYVIHPDFLRTIFVPDFSSSFVVFYSACNVLPLLFIFFHLLTFKQLLSKELSQNYMTKLTCLMIYSEHHLHVIILSTEFHIFQLYITSTVPEEISKKIK